MAVDESVRFIMRLFAKHYREAKLHMPERFAKREFGFMFFDRDFVIRHQAFPSRAALKKYLAEQAPSHVYYSCAYYEKPGAPTMAEKKWLGADLIFDLDADHVEGAKELPYEKMLERVKVEVKRLIDEFLIGDFGFSADELRIVFSGGRGYHVHISDPRVLRLTSHERREIVDYITGTGLDLNFVFPSTPFEKGRFKERVDVERRRALPKLQDGGWRARIRQGIDELLVELDELEKEEAVKRLDEMLRGSGKEIGRKTTEGLYEDLFMRRRGKRGADRMREDDAFEVFSEKRHADAFLAVVERRVRGRMKGETDEPVTSDVKRLIRLPSSIHGRTGFEVVPMTRDALEDFDPFRDAVPRAFGDEEVRLFLEKPVQLRLRDGLLTLDEGDNTVPEYAAVHLICRKLAIIRN
jgi:DNA primase small subunit